MASISRPFLLQDVFVPLIIVANKALAGIVVQYPRRNSKDNSILRDTLRNDLVCAYNNIVAYGDFPNHLRTRRYVYKITYKIRLAPKFTFPGIPYRYLLTHIDEFTDLGRTANKYIAKMTYIKARSYVNLGSNLYPGGDLNAQLENISDRF